MQREHGSKSSIEGTYAEATRRLRGGYAEATRRLRRAVPTTLFAYAGAGAVKQKRSSNGNKAMLEYPIEKQEGLRRISQKLEVKQQARRHFSVFRADKHVKYSSKIL